ncbi:hypothetical protein [Granulicoccus sp. GXG6511]|uniref:hypothetical protein n=1 Tax=Granulicoccus sp. GXG6511 TaxID=3381351 RepID=UPI003D7CADE9
MAGWQIGLVVMMAVGVAVILFGALWDRERNRRRTEQLSRPPDRPIPGFEGEAPAYVSTHPPQSAGHRPLTDEQRSEIGVRVKSLPGFAARLAAGELVSDPVSDWAVVNEARVLVCAGPVLAFRELLPFLDRAAGSRTPVVIAAPAFDAQTLETFVVNHLHRTLLVVAVTAEPPVLADLAAATGSTPVARADLQSGWVPDTSIGSAETWVSSVDRCWVL